MSSPSSDRNGVTSLYIKVAVTVENAFEFLAGIVATLTSSLPAELELPLLCGHHLGTGLLHHPVTPVPTDSSVNEL